MVTALPDDSLYWLAETKFLAPSMHEDVVTRRRLLDDIHTGQTTHALTLLSAPAGYGKTTLLATFPLAYPDLFVAWLSLDEEDNDPVRFLIALIRALQNLNPNCGATAQALVQGQTQPGVEPRRVASVLINDILEAFSNPFVVILDDLHRISNPAIFVALDHLLEHAPPQMHLIVGTRVDPPLALARLRARGQLVELRTAELRFTIREATALFNGQLGLGLSPDDVQLLHVRMEGWPVGLRLLGASLQRAQSAEERRLFIHHLPQVDQNIFDFLADEVFNQQEPALREFLLQTSVLPELTAPLCRAVSGRNDAAIVLDELYRRNLFVLDRHPPSAVEGQAAISLEGGSRSPTPTYRYHDLFAEFLHHRLQQEIPERVPHLHLRAAKAERDPARAVEHYLAAASWQEAAALIEQIGAEMFNRGYLDTLSRWIKALPASVRESHPRLLHYLSNCVFWKGAWGEVESLLERALKGFEAAGDGAGRGEVLADLATCAAAAGDLERSAELWGRALSYPIPPHTRVQSLLGRGLSKAAWGEWVETERDFNAAMTLIEQSGSLDPLYLLVLPYFHPGFAVLPGGLEKVERICRQARAQVGDEVSPSRLMVDEMTTVLHLFRGRLTEAIASGESALALRVQLGGHPYLSLNAALFLMIAHAARGDFTAVEPLFDLLFLGIDQTGQPPPDLPTYLFYAGRIRWLQGRLQEAHTIYDQMIALTANSPLRESPEALICRTWMRSLLQVTEGRYARAERTLRRPEVLQQRDRASTIDGCTRLMLARLYLQQNRQQEALAEFEPVLAYHERLGIPFPILLEGQSVVPLLRLAAEEGVQERYVTYLLGLLGTADEPRPVDVPGTGTSLTPREVEVLGLVAAGYSNRAIAEELVISEWTVKSHLTKVYRKLDVSSRTQAVARAREVGLG